MLGSWSLLNHNTSLPIAAGVAALLTFCPSKIRTLDVRGFAATSLTIKVDRLSPAFVALEDARQISFDPFLLDEQSDSIPSKQEFIALKAGSRFDHTLIPSYEKPEPTRKVQLAQVKSTDAKNLGQPQKPPVKALRLAGLKVSQGADSNDQTQATQTVNVEPSLYGEDGDLKPLNVRKDELRKYYKQTEMAAAYPTLKQRAKDLIEREADSSSPEQHQDYEWMPSQVSSSGIFIGKGQVASSASSAPRAAFHKSQTNKPASQPKPRPSSSTEQKLVEQDGKNQKEDLAKTLPSKPDFSTAALKKNPSKNRGGAFQPAQVSLLNLRPMTLNGQLEITGGLAFTSDTYISLSRVSGGVQKEEGKIWVRDGSFEIWIKEPSGYLVAELRAKSGELLGRGEYDLFKMPQPKDHQAQVSQVRIQIEPAVTGIEVDAISAHSFGYNRIEVEDAEVHIDALNETLVKDERGRFIDQDILPTSSYILRGQAKNHWGSLAIGLSETTYDVRLFPNSTMEALLNLAQEQLGLPVMATQNQGVIWGRVTKNGQPVRGATVELAGGYSTEPIYFNALYLPDRSLKQTSSNGLFAYVLVPPGIHSVRAQHQGRYFPARVLPTQSRHVSYTSLEMNEMRTANIKIYDALDPSRKLPAVIDVMGLETQYEIEGEANIQYSSGSGLMMIEASSSERYEPIRIQVSRHTKQFNFPMVRKDWLASLVTTRRINLSPDRGTIIGFVEGNNYKVFLDKGVQVRPENVVYFDAEGRVLTSKTGVAGGGFAIFNVPPGYRSVHVVPENSRKLMSRVLVAESEVVNVLSADVSD